MVSPLTDHPLYATLNKIYLVKVESNNNSFQHLWIKVDVYERENKVEPTGFVRVTKTQTTFLPAGWGGFRIKREISLVSPFSGENIFLVNSHTRHFLNSLEE